MTNDFIPSAALHRCAINRDCWWEVRPTHAGGPEMPFCTERLNLSLVDLLGISQEDETRTSRRRAANRAGSHRIELDYEIDDVMQSLLHCPRLQTLDERCVRFKEVGHLRLAVANVCTLFPAEVKRATSGAGHVDAARISVLEHSSNAAGYDVIGVLESRLQGDVVSSGAFYDMYSVGADEHGCCGTQLWVRRSLRARVSAITPRSPRRLTGVLHVAGGAIAIIVAHSPHEYAPLADKNHFYRNLEAATQGMQRGRQLALLADMNARVGSVTAPSIGECGSEDENDNGSRMRLFLQCQGLCAVNTVCASGCGPTWTGSRGHRSRLDYIGLSIPSLRRVSACYVDDTVDLATAVRDDHFVVVVDFLPQDVSEVVSTEAPTSDGKPEMTQRTARIDAKKLADPCRRAAFQNQLGRVFDEVESSELPSDKSPARIDERLRQWNTQVLTLARGIFGSRSTKPNKQLDLRMLLGLCQMDCSSAKGNQRAPSCEPNLHAAHRMAWLGIIMWY